MSTWKYSRGINRWEETIVFLSISKGERDWSDGDRVQHLWLPWRRWRTALGPAGVGPSWIAFSSTSFEGQHRCDPYQLWREQGSCITICSAPLPTPLLLIDTNVSGEEFSFQLITF